MDSYNSDKSAFVFLLSTRAGGLGARARPFRSARGHAKLRRS
jgi:hypothetical protein